MPLPSGLRAASAGAGIGLKPSRDVRATSLSGSTRGQGLDAVAGSPKQNGSPATCKGWSRRGIEVRTPGGCAGRSRAGEQPWRQELRRKVWASAAYPVAVLGVVIALTFFICHLSSRIAEQISTGKEFGVDGSPLVDIMYKLTKYIADHDLWIAGGMALTAILAFLVWRFCLSAPARQRSVEAVPLYGTMVRFMALAEFCHLTALLVEANTPLPAALNLAGGSVRDSALAETCGQVATRVAEGHPLAEALQGWTTLPASLGQILAWGEDQQDLARALRFAGDVFETRAESQANFSSQVIGATLLILILCWVGFAIAMIYLPIAQGFRLLTALSG